jgi:large subunit ribosomal protein L6
MSRVGKKPILIPEGVKVEINKSKIQVKGPKGELEREIPSVVKVVIKDKQILVQRLNEDTRSKSLHGTLRSLIFNMVRGVSEGFERVLEVVGVGYKVILENGVLTLRVGYSHPVRYTGPEDVRIEVPNPNTIRVFGCDKQKVGEVAAEIRAVKKPEPYKGKGIRYKGEVIRRKVGKAALATK